MGLYKSTTVRKRTDGTTYKVRSKKWYAAFQHPPTGNRVHLCLGVTDKAAAQQLFAAKITEAAIQTTMKYYIHVADHRKVEAIDKLPDLSGGEPSIIRLAEAS